MTLEQIDLAADEISLSLEQQRAIELCCDLSQVIVGITGGAGTGKTVVLGRAYEEVKGPKVLCAPTGRAAKRIQELTGIKAKTVHRLLEFPMPDDDTWDADTDVNEPKRNSANPLAERVIFVDESSMLAPTLYRQLMSALPRDGVIRFFGDNNQLPPVEDDSPPPFIEILRKFPKVELTFNYRSEDEIVSNALRILRGSLPLRNARFEIIYCDQPLVTMLRFATREFMQATHQIIMPTRMGRYGTVRVNPSLQTKFNGKGSMLRLDRFNVKGKEQPQLTVRAGDKFLWIKNDYTLNMFNGEIGYIKWVDPEDGDLELVTPERAIYVPAREKVFSPYHGTVIQYDPRKQIELGYAITTHKSQGSEFDTVIYCICAGQSYLLNKRNFYTAVTRAKNQVIVIADRRGMSMSMKPARV